MAGYVAPGNQNGLLRFYASNSDLSQGINEDGNNDIAHGGPPAVDPFLQFRTVEILNALDGKKNPSKARPTHKG